ncbi:CCD84 protein, partial [Odontophorus gujanensis]|nr:CCD84 protein [Odontophorus gujanensis]
MAVYYCALCRRTSFTGRRHLYSAAHRRRLQEALGRLEEEGAAARAAVDGADVRRHDPSEDERRARAEHRREAARFCRENRVEAALRERFVVAEEEYARFAAAMERAVGAYEEREEESIRQMAARIREAERRQRDTVRAALEYRGSRCFFLNPTQPPTEPQRCAGPPGCSSAAGPARDTTRAELPGPSVVVQTGPHLSWMGSGQALTFIGHQETEGKGNVHTGAKPPWLTEEDEEDGSKQQIGPSYEEFLKQKEKQKLKKLPAERVGANFDHTSQTGDSWLPSFGRVWNHGRRWQSR